MTHLSKTLWLIIKNLPVSNIFKPCFARTDNLILDEIILSTDRYFLLDILDTNLPLKLTVPKIPDDVYWKKCYLEKWPKQIPTKVKPIETYEILRENGPRTLSSVYNSSGSNSSSSKEILCSRKSSLVSENSQNKNVKTENFERTWKEYYLEMYLKEYLENLKPENYDLEKIKELSDLCSSYVRVLRTEQLQCSENSPNRIPLNSILGGFQNLKELSLCFKQTYVGEQFSWKVLNTAFQDIKLLAKGLEKLRLQTLRITNSDVDCEKLVIILKALLKHEIRVLDFNQCKIADKGTLAISKFILEVPVKEVILANNRIGPKGVEYLSYALLQQNCGITKLDLHLNLLNDAVGNVLLNALTYKGSSLISLFLNGCGFSDTFSVGRLFQTNNSLEILDISNNNLGENVGQGILEELKYNTSIKKLDLRMCRIPSETEWEIQELVNNRKRVMLLPTGNEVQDNLKIEPNNDKLNAEFEAILK